MPLETKPSPLPPDWDTYVPAGSHSYNPKTKESWETLAQRPEVKNLGMSANDLCYFNFRTRNPREINWYLHYKVGCQHPTHDGKNYVFTTGDRNPIYLPQVGARPLVEKFPPKREDPRLNLWIGLGAKAGTTFVVAGIETMEGVAVSLDEPHQWMGIHATTNRLGLGWGVTGGVCIIMITGVSRPAQLHGLQDGDWDFSLALGESWDKVAKGARAANKFRPVIEAMAKIGARTPSALKRALKADPDRYSDLVKAVRGVKDSLNVPAEPKVFLIDVPWLGGGVEVSVFFGVANYEATYQSD